MQTHYFTFYFIFLLLFIIFIIFLSSSLWFIGLLHRFFLPFFVCLLLLFLVCAFVQTLTNAQFHTNVYVLKYLAQICCESLIDVGIKFRLLFLKRLHMVHPLFQLTFSQINPGTLESSIHQSLELTSSSLAHFSPAVWSSLSDSLGFQSAPKCLNHVRYVSYCMR